MDTDFNILVVGCGGTGGNYIKELGRFLHGNRIRSRCQIILMDGDLVEEENIARQPFLPQDVGRKKAEVMAEILQEAFGISCHYYPEYIGHVADLEQFHKGEGMTLLIGCVDNHACRKTLHAYFQKAVSCYYLDAANEYSVGEVVAAMRMADIELAPDRAHYFPDVLESQSSPRGEESCLAINAFQPQHLITNLFAANLLLKCTVEILTGDNWSGGIYYFDAFKGYSTFKEWK